MGPQRNGSCEALDFFTEVALPSAFPSHGRPQWLSASRRVWKAAWTRAERRHREAYCFSPKPVITVSF